MLKNILLAVVLTLSTVTVFAGKGKHGSPKPSSPGKRHSKEERRFLEASPTKSDFDSKIHELKEALRAAGLTDAERGSLTHQLNTTRHQRDALSPK